MQYLILGNSAAAIAAVDAIRSIDEEGAITMVSPEDCLAYGTPLISYVLEGKTTVENAALRDERWYVENGVNRVFGAGKAAVTLDASAKVVTLEDGTQLPYDKLLVATGSTPSQPRVEGLPESAPNSFTFNTMSDAIGIMDYLHDDLAAKFAAGEEVNVIISGSGLIGAKAAEGICEHVTTTYLVGHAQRVLRKLLDEEASPLLEALMEQNGIVNVPGTVIVSVECDEAGKVVRATLDDGRVLPCDILITAIGVRPNVGVLASAGAEVTRGAVVDEHLRTSLPDVYAAGDVANTHNTLLGEDVPLALWPTASDQGHVAGRHMAGDAEATFNGTFARNAVGFFGQMNILGCGIINPAPDAPDIESVVSVEGSRYSKFNVRDGKLVGYLLMNRPEAAGIYTTIIKKGIPLAELPDDIFERTPEMRDLPRPLRDRSMLKGYVTGGHAAHTDIVDSSMLVAPVSPSAALAAEGGATTDLGAQSGTTTRKGL